VEAFNNCPQLSVNISAHDLSLGLLTTLKLAGSEIHRQRGEKLRKASVLGSVMMCGALMGRPVVELRLGQDMRPDLPVSAL
jgi:hypothetical protein